MQSLACARAQSPSQTIPRARAAAEKITACKLRVHKKAIEKVRKNKSRAEIYRALSLSLYSLPLMLWGAEKKRRSRKIMRVYYISRG